MIENPHAQFVENEVDDLITVKRDGDGRKIGTWLRSALVYATATVAINVALAIAVVLLFDDPVPALVVLAVPAACSLWFFGSLIRRIREHLKLMKIGDRWFVERLRDASIERIHRAEAIGRNVNHIA